MDRRQKLAEIDRNYDAFQRHVRRFMIDHADQYALLKGGEVIGFYDHVQDASEEASRRFSDGMYSIQQVVEDPIDLGFFSHAGG